MEYSFLIIAFLSGIFGTILGFGTSTLLLPLSLLFFEFKTALVLVALFHFFSNIGRISFFRKSLDKKLVIYFGIPSIILTFIGAKLVNYLPSEILIFILGIFLFTFSIVSMWKPKIKFNPSNKNAVVGGGLSGFFAGILGTGGAIRSFFLTSFKLKKNVYLATAALIALLIDIVRIPVYFYNRLLQPIYYYLILPLFFIAIISSYVGKKVVDKTPEKDYLKFVYFSIGLISLKFISDGLIYLL